MRRLNFYIFMVCIAAVAILSSCDPKEEEANITYDNGVFVVNEGNYSPANGTVSFYNPTTKASALDIFRSSNAGKKLAVVQSMTVDGDAAYLILNNGNKIQIVNSSTFKDEGVISGPSIVTPRYLSIINGKGYLSVWGPYDEHYSLIDSYILVLDLKNKTVLDTIDTDEGVERLLYNGSKLFASNYNYGSSKTLAVINPTDNSLIDQIELSAGPLGLTTDANGKVWVICTGTFAGNNGVLYRINPTSLEIENSFELGINPKGDLVASKDGKTLFYNESNTVYKMTIDAKTAPSEPFITEASANTFYGLGYDNKNDLLYAGNNKSFEKNGVVYRYKPEGVKVDTFSCGIAPNGFVFKN